MWAILQISHDFIQWTWSFVNFGYLRWVLDPIPHEYQGTTMPIFTNWKKSEEDFHFYQKKKSQKQNRVWCLFCRVWRLWRQHAPLQGEWGPKFLPRTTHSISASSCCNLEQCLWASVLYLNSFCVSISTEYFVCPKIIISLL